MLVQRLTSRGVTLIELVIGLLIVSLVMGFGVPSFSNWIQNAKIRTATEAAQNGLQLARVEALKRNATVCVVLNNDTSWVISSCGSGTLIQERKAAEGSSSITIATVPTSFTFNSLGRLTFPIITDKFIKMDFSSTTNGSSCVELRCMSLIVYPTGQVSMCDPDPALTDTDPRKCPAL